MINTTQLVWSYPDLFCWWDSLQLVTDHAGQVELLFLICAICLITNYSNCQARKQEAIFSLTNCQSMDWCTDRYRYRQTESERARYIWDPDPEVDFIDRHFSEVTFSHVNFQESFFEIQLLIHFALQMLTYTFLFRMISDECNINHKHQLPAVYVYVQN